MAVAVVVAVVVWIVPVFLQGESDDQEGSKFCSALNTDFSSLAGRPQTLTTSTEA